MVNWTTSGLPLSPTDFTATVICPILSVSPPENAGGLRKPGMHAGPSLSERVSNPYLDLRSGDRLSSFESGAVLYFPKSPSTQDAASVLRA